MFTLLLETDEISAFLYMIEAGFIAVLGLAFGSFSSALIYRVPRKLPWAGARERSQCTACKKALTVLDLIPVLSWMLYRGKCRHCKAPVSALYPALELLSAALCLLVFFIYGGSVLEQYLFIFAVPFLLALAVIDLQHKTLPNQLVAVLAGIGALYVVVKIAVPAQDVQGVLWNHLGGAVLFGALSLLIGTATKKILHKDALGMGDVKFFAVAGLWLGAVNVGAFCILSGILGIALGLLWRQIRGEREFPFGPALIVSFFLILLFDGSFFLEKTLHYSQF